MTPWPTRVFKAGNFTHRILPAFLITLCLLLLFSDGLAWFGHPVSPDSHTVLTISGETMGTRYRVLVRPGMNTGVKSLEVLNDSIRARLSWLDRGLFSTYAPDSELSRLNATPPGSAMSVSSEMIQVLENAVVIYRNSGGAFDPSVKPLVDLWGFGAVSPTQLIPDADAINAGLAMKGFDSLLIDSERKTVTKSHPLALDLSAIAKGYAVDQVGQMIENHHIRDYLIDIGGEVLVSGNRSEGVPWNVAIERPDDLQFEKKSLLYQQVRTENGKTAIAGSGDYRNFFIHEGRRYSHTINPESGWPISHDLASVTVIADSVMAADAWATALLVLGLKEGLLLANELQLAAYFIVSGSNGYSARHSEAFNRYF